MSYTNSALEAAAAEIARSTRELTARRAGADSALAQKIIAANRRPTLGYGMVGGAQVFVALMVGPTVADLKRKAAEAILAHRQMRAAGGNSYRWLNEAATFRAAAAAMVESGRTASLQLAAE